MSLSFFFVVTVESSLNFNDDEHRKLLENFLVLQSANKMDMIFWPNLRYKVEVKFFLDF